MKDNSTMERNEYLFETIWTGLVTMIWFRKLLFRCLPDMTYAQSKGVLWGMLVASIVFGTFVLFCYLRTGWTSAVCVILPFGIYTVLAHGDAVKQLIVFAVIVAAAVSLLYTVRLLRRRIRRAGKTGRRRIRVNRLYKCLCFSQLCFAAALLAIMAFLIVQQVFGTTIHASAKAIQGSASQEQTIRNNMDTVLLLREKEWSRLSVKQRVDVLQCIANIEAHYLGLPHELNVIARDLTDDASGCYSDQTHTICISREHIREDSASSVLSTLCHEAFHSYEHRLVDEYNRIDTKARNLRIYENVSHYAAEFGEYIDGSEDFSEYYDQYCESDSRDYAEEAVNEYYRKISEYLGG